MIDTYTLKIFRIHFNEKNELLLNNIALKSKSLFVVSFVCTIVLLALSILMALLISLWERP